MLNHACQRLSRKSVRRMMESKADPSTVWVFVVPMASGLTAELKSVPLQGSGEATGCQRAEAAVVDLHHTVTVTSGSS